MCRPYQTSSQLAAESTAPVPLLMVVVSSNRVMLNIIHGASVHGADDTGDHREADAPGGSQVAGEQGEWEHDEGEHRDQLAAAQPAAAPNARPSSTALRIVGDCQNA